MAKTTPRALELDMMARMSEDWSDTTSAMLSVTIAMILRHFGRMAVTVPLDSAKIVMAKYDIDRTYHEVDGVPFMTVTLTEKADVISGIHSRVERIQEDVQGPDVTSSGVHG